MKLEGKDLRIGQRVLWLKNEREGFKNGFISSISIRSVDNFLKSKDNTEITITLLDGYANEVETSIEYFKRSDWMMFSNYAWCLPNCTKYIDHVNKLCSGKNTNKTVRDYDKYKNFAHDNNDKQREARLQKQRDFINKAMEQGYIYVNQLKGWEKTTDFKVYFKDGNYRIDTEFSGTDFINCKHINKAVSLTNLKASK